MSDPATTIRTLLKVRKRLKKEFTMISVSVTAKQISVEFWLVTLTISESQKVSTIRELVVTEQQLAFLKLLDGFHR